VLPDPARLAGSGTEDGLLLVLDAAVASGALPADTPPPGLRKLYDTYVDGLLRNNRLTAPYRPVPASVPLVLVTAERGLLPDDRTLGWEPLAPHGLEVHRSPGDHYTMLTRPDAAAVIARLVHPAECPAGCR
jgi:thioesterase domain-containing protein